MAKFKKGDKVVRQSSRLSEQWIGDSRTPLAAFVVSGSTADCVVLEGVKAAWDEDYFDLYVEPQHEPVTVTKPSVQQIPGVPDGYRLVRIGRVLKGQQYISSGDGCIHTAQWDLTHSALAIVEPSVPPAPPTPIPTTVKVQLNRYLIGCTNETHRVLVCTQEYIDRNCSNYRLLGPSETLELEVEV